MSAVCVTITGSLPPISRKQGIRRSAQASATLRPVGTLPVKQTRSTLRITSCPVAPSPSTKSNTSASSGTRRTVSNQRADEARRHLARLEQHRGTGEQRRHRIEQRQHHRRVPGADHADERIGHQLRADLDVGHRQRTAADLRALQHAGSILGPAVDVRDGDEGLELRGVAAAGIGAIGRGDVLGLRDQLSDPAAHDARRAPRPAGPPRRPGSRAGAQPSPPPRAPWRPSSRNSIWPVRGLRTGSVREASAFIDSPEFSRILSRRRAIRHRFR